MPLGWSDEEIASHLRDIARAVERFCRAHVTEALAREAAGAFPDAAWKGLAELGVLGLGAGGDGGAVEIAAAMEALGRDRFPGPLVATFVAARLLDAEDRSRLVGGELVVALGEPPLVAWAPHAHRFIVLDAGRAFLARPTGPIEAVATLGGEPWGRVALERERDLGDATDACALGDIAMAAFLVGAGDRLVNAASEHARTRKQFGRVIGEFQAIAHPLANAAVRLRAAGMLALTAARAIDAGEGSAAADAAAARWSAIRAALEAAAVAPQTFGALGVVLEGPVFPFARRIRQWATAPDERVRTRDALLISLRLDSTPPPPDRRVGEEGS